MAFVTAYAKLLQMNAFQELINRKEIDVNAPAFEGLKVDQMQPGETIAFYCPLGCSNQIEIQENTIGALNDAITAHFKICDKGIERKVSLEPEPPHMHSISDEAKATGLPDDSLPLHFPDGQMGRCKVDPKTGHMIVTSMWMDNGNKYKALTTLLDELIAGYSRFSATVPIDAIRRGMAEIEKPTPPTDFRYLANHPKGFA